MCNHILFYQPEIKQTIIDYFIEIVHVYFIKSLCLKEKTKDNHEK